MAFAIGKPAYAVAATPLTSMQAVPDDDDKDKDKDKEKAQEKEKAEEPRPETRHYDGIDISDHQKHIDWPEVAKDKNIKYVYIKATEGATYVSNLYRYNLENAHKHGIKVGSYHFLRTGSRIRDQFENFKRIVKKNEQDLLPVIDVEVRQGWTNQQLRDSVKLFADLVEEHYGCRPLIYTSSSFYDNILGRSFNIYPLFIARYSASQPTLKSGNDWVMWQFSERGRIRGISTNVDLSCFNKGRSLSDIMIRSQRIGQKKRTNTDLVENQEKPSGVKVKEAPTMSKQQEKELKKKQEKEQKARERAQKLAQEEAQKKAEQERKQKEKEQKQKEKEKKQKQEQAAKEKELQKRAAEQKAEQQKKQQQAEQQKKQQQTEQQKKAEQQKQQERKDRAQKAQQQQQKQQSEQQKKKQEQQDKLKQQKQQSQTQNLPTRTRANAHSNQQKDKKTNKSSADND